MHEVGRQGETVYIVSDFIEGLPEEAARLVHRRAMRRFEDNRKSRLIKSGGRFIEPVDGAQAQRTGRSEAGS